LSVALLPFLPDTSARLRKMLNLPATFEWNDLLISHLPKGHAIGLPEILFKKIEDAEVELQLQKLEASKAARPQPAKAHHPVKPAISYDDFMKMDIRVGTILEAVKVPKADKLLQLLVDTGVDKRTVVSGIAEHFAPEAIIGQQVSLLLNLEPRKIKGIESQGMILMAEDADGKLKFVQPGEAVNPGAEIR
jgi:methionyl-tRNA synthetase